MISQGWDVFLVHVLPWIIQTTVAAAAALIAFLILLPSKWGEAYLKHRLERDLEVHKSSLNRDFEHYREQLDHLADRGKRSNEMEFNAIKLVWEQFVEAFLATNACIAQPMRTPNFRSMSAAEFTSFLSASDLSDGQKQQLTNAQDRVKTYSDILTWRSIVNAQNAIFDTRLLLRKQSIFMPAAMKDEFVKAIDLLSSAQIEQQMDHQHRQSGIGHDKRSTLINEGERIFAALGIAANRRLFRGESGRHDSPSIEIASIPSPNK
jgi:hypothetical protein